MRREPKHDGEPTKLSSPHYSSSGTLKSSDMSNLVSPRPSGLKVGTRGGKRAKVGRLPHLAPQANGPVSPGSGGSLSTLDSP